MCACYKTRNSGLRKWLEWSQLRISFHTIKASYKRRANASQGVLELNINKNVRLNYTLIQMRNEN